MHFTPGPLHRLRCTTVAAVATGLGTGAVTVLLGQLGGPADTADQAVVRMCVVALLACTGWAWAATCSVVVQALRGAPVHTPGVPAGLRRAVLLACGVALAGSLAGSGHASQGGERDPGRALSGLPMPERALGPAHAAHLPDVPPSPPLASVVVRRGDSLWLIAARGLPSTADAAAISAHWQRVYRLNRAVIGPCPDLIHPGQRLLLPPVPAR